MASVNSELVLNFMKDNYPNEYSKQQISEALGISLPAVIGTINALTKKGYCAVTHEDVIELEAATDTRKAKTKTIKYHALTEAGLAYDPVAEAAQKAAEKEAAKAAKAAAKANAQ